MRDFLRGWVGIGLLAVALSACGGNGGEGGGPASGTSIGSEGGELALPEGGRLTVPPGALDAEVAISVSVVSTPEIPGFEPVGPVYHFEPEGTTFAVPATVELPFDGDGEALVALWTDPDGSWTQLAATVGDGVLVAEVEHFSEGTAAKKAGPECGNGVKEGAEECESQTDCETPEICVNCTCTPTEGCGDGIVQAGEACEQDQHCGEGEACNTDDCTCITAPVCGNDKIEWSEDCETDGDCAEGKICHQCTCIFDQTCGNGVLEGDEKCEKGIGCQDPVAQVCDPDSCDCFDHPECGNGVVEFQETCENDEDCDHDGEYCFDCKCRNPGFCGNDVLNNGEECDPPGSACDPGICDQNCQCVEPTCMDGQLEDGEECETNVACSGGKVCVDCKCVDPECGDGVVEGYEDCESDDQCPEGKSCEACACVSESECGDGIKADDEACEDDAHCQADGGDEICENCFCVPPEPPGCGNQIIEEELGEDCESDFHCGPNELCTGCVCTNPLSDGIWTSGSGLRWDASPPQATLYYSDAVNHCQDLTLGGYSWRLPTITEAMAVVTGCQAIEVCGVTESCDQSNQCELDCYACPNSQGPGVTGCYTHPTMPWPYSCGYAIWTQSACVGDVEGYWIMKYDTGQVFAHHGNSYTGVRCVSGP